MVKISHFNESLEKNFFGRAFSSVNRFPRRAITRNLLTRRKSTIFAFSTSLSAFVAKIKCSIRSSVVSVIKCSSSQCDSWDHFWSQLPLLHAKRHIGFAIHTQLGITKLVTSFSIMLMSPNLAISGSQCTTKRQNREIFAERRILLHPKF